MLISRDDSPSLRLLAVSGFRGGLPLEREPHHASAGSDGLRAPSKTHTREARAGFDD